MFIQWVDLLLISIKMIFLFSYPSSFIHHQFQQFFKEYIQLSPFLPSIENEQQFHVIRQTILNQPTSQQSQIAMSAATADLDNDPMDKSEIELQQSTTTEKKKTTNYHNQVILHYTHEKRFHSFKRDIHHQYEQTFQNTPAMDLKLIVGNRNRRDARHELIRKRPKLSLLQNKPINNRSLKFLGKSILY